MEDVLFVAILVAFFALMVLFVRGCERIVGREEPEEVATLEEHREHEEALA